MKTSFFHFVLCLIVGCLPYVVNSRAAAAPLPSAEDVCGVIDVKHDNRNYARTFAQNLNVGEPRTVRLIHFVPNERVYSSNVAQNMKAAILEAQRFYTEQTRKTFKIEMDSSDQPKVHRVIGQHPRSYYRDKHYRKIFDAVWDEIKQQFHLGQNIYLVVLDNNSHLIGNVAGTGGHSGKNGGMALVAEEFTWEIVAHELGHAFGLAHDFRDNAYIMSYGGSERQSLSDCNARFLNVHPYFNTRIPTREEDVPTIELISEDAYPADAANVPINLKINDFDRIHQVLLFVKTRGPHPSAGSLELIDCNRYGRFNYDGHIPSTRTSQLSDMDWHRVYVRAIDVDGDIGEAVYCHRKLGPPPKPRL